MFTIEMLDFNTVGNPSVVVDVMFRKGAGRWNVVRVDNGRVLGWVTKDSGATVWEARVASEAFCGAGPDDRGDVLDKVPYYLFCGSGPMTAECLAVGRTRFDAALEIVAHLVAHHAPAVGFGRHNEVRPWGNH